MPIIPFDLTQARLYAERFAELASRGIVIGDRDLQIAVTALNLNFELATLNVGEFQRVTGLRLVDVSSFVVT
jgi:tRNA(fMet)-specific endonuclease VapC